MLEGLDFSIICFKDIDKIQHRLDSEYYSKQNIALEQQIKSYGCHTLEELGAKLDCSAFYPSITEDYNFTRQGVPFIRVNEIQNGLIQISDSTAFLPEIVIDQNSNTIAKAYPGDIVIAKGGNTLAKTGILTTEYPVYSICRDVILLRTNDIPSNLHYCVWAFLHSELGYNLMIRTASQTGQPHLTLPNILKLTIPSWSCDFAKEIDNCYNRSVALKNEIARSFSEIENLLLEELSLKNWNPTEQLTTQKTFTDFLESGRFDAEYYQAKYDQIEEKIKQYKNGYTQIKCLFNVLSSSSPSEYQSEGTKVIKTKNVRIPVVDYENITDCTNEGSLMVQQHDLLFASMGVGSLGRVSYINDKVKDYTVDGTIKILRAIDEGNNIEIPTMLFLTSKYGQELIYKYVIGSTGIISISKDNIENLIIPIIDKDVALSVTKRVLETINMKLESKRLLDLAKTAVEIAIEQGEEKAIELLRM